MRLDTIRAALIFLLMFASGSFAEEGKMKIVFLGDSLTAGYGVGEQSAFPALIERELNGERERVAVVNAGVSGDTTAGGLRRAKWLLKSKPDFFVVALGANDALRGLPVEKAEENLEGILELVLKSVPRERVVLAGMKAPPSLGPEYVQKFDAIYPKIARRLELKFIPFLLEGVAGDRSKNLPDLIHPNESGHRVIAERVLPVFKELVEGKRG